MAQDKKKTVFAREERPKQTASLENATNRLPRSVRDDQPTPSLRAERSEAKQSVETKQSLRMERSEAKQSVDATRTLVPKLRFKEFHGEWERKKLGDISTFSKGKSITKSDIDENGKLECIRYGELYTTYGEIIKEIASKTNLNSDDLILSDFNDVIIPASGETQIDIATASCVMKDGVALGGDLNIIKSKANGVFLSYYLNSKRKIDIARLSQGISVVHLYSSQLKTLNLNLPQDEEQQKIASFLSAVDEKIQQLTKKKALLEQYKKGVMQQLFSGTLRFKDENGEDFPEWEEKRLGELAERNTNKNRENKVNFVLTNSATQGIVSQSDYFDRDIANQNNLTGYYIVELDDFIYNPRISVHAPVGPIKRNKLEQGVMSPLYSVFKFKVENLEYFEYYFETVNWHRYLENVSNMGARHDRMNITNVDFFKMPIPFPCDAERIKIADYLSAIDTKIETVNQQIEKTQDFKKGLLQQLFAS
tara:strand:+ start:1922 stop:3358 length:1437 start_codon:yes stop_codon:yes gene_type:complete